MSSEAHARHTAIEKVALNSGDCLIVHLTNDLDYSDAECDQIKKGFEGIFPDNRIVVTQGVRLSVVTKTQTGGGGD